MKAVQDKAFSFLPYVALFTLGLSASYGVFQFGLLYVPWYVSLITAAAFELTYVGLSVVTIRTHQEKDKATWVARGAVFVSVAYNVISGYLHRNPVTRLDWWLEIIFAILHGAPLAIVAYALASLLLHSRETDATSTTITLPKRHDRQGKESSTGKESATSTPATSVKVEVPGPLSLPNGDTSTTSTPATSTDDKRTIAHQLASQGYTQAQIGETIGVSRQRVGQLLRGE